LEEGGTWERLEVSRSMLFERMLYICSGWKVAAKKGEGWTEDGYAIQRRGGSAIKNK